MNDYEYHATCPHCGKMMDHLGYVGEVPLEALNENDAIGVTLCIYCENFSMVCPKHPMGMRIPTMTEQIEIDASEPLQMMKMVLNIQSRVWKAPTN